MTFMGQMQPFGKAPSGWVSFGICRGGMQVSGCMGMCRGSQRR